MRKYYWIFQCSWVIFFALVVDAAHFYVSEGSEKCFIESVPKGVTLTVLYENYDNPGITCSILYKDPSGRQVYAKEVSANAPKGKVTHLTGFAGDYKVCINCASFKWFATTLLKWSLSIELGEGEVNLQELAKKQDFTSVEYKLLNIKNKLEVIVAENDYEKEQELSFTKVTESINSKILWISVTQILLLVFTTLFTIFHLTRFFRSQKLF